MRGGPTWNAPHLLYFCLLNMNIVRMQRLVLLMISFLVCVYVTAQNRDVINPIKLQAAVHVDKMTRSLQQGDTLIHKANAYQVMQGADSEALLSKMAGVSVSDSGVEAGGREVARILLDGQEFFGNDVLTALRSIPADLVKQVEVINRLSDNAQLTGVDDGEGYTAINIVTKKKENKKGTLAGRVYGSCGLPDGTYGDIRHNYIAGGNISRFAEGRTFNLIGMSNNISKFNFVSSDVISGVSGQNEGSGKEFNVKALPGISAVHSLGANYSSKKANLTYFFNFIGNDNHPESDRSTMTSSVDRQQRVLSNTDYNASDMTHRLTGKLTFNPAKRHTLIFRPEVTFEKLNDASDLYAAYSYVYTDGTSEFLRNQLNSTTNDRWVFRASPSLNYHYAFKSKRARSLAMYAKYSYYRFQGCYGSAQYRFRKEDTDFDLSGEDMYGPYLQNKDSKTSQHTGTASVTYTEPLNKHSRISLQYVSILTNTATDNHVAVRNNANGIYEESDRLSAVSSAIFLHNRVRGRYNYAFRKMNVTAGATYQHTMFRGDVRLPSVGQTHRNYHHFLYQLTANLPFDKRNVLKIEAKSKTANPSNRLLQDVVNMSSTSHIRAGNPDLKPAYLHEAEIRYTFTDNRSGSTLSVLASCTGSSDYFCDSLVINNPDFVVMEGVTLGENNQYVKPVNLNGYYKLYGRVAYSIPLSLIRCNLNLNATASMRRMPSMVNGDYVPVNNNWYQLGGRIDSNISRYLDFSAGYEARYSSNEYSGKFGVRHNNYVFHRVTAKVKWVFGDGFTLSAAAQYKRFVSVLGLYDDNLILCDVFMGKKFLKSKRLEVSLGVNDLFNDNVRQYWHSVSASGTSDGFNIGLGRYLSAQCIWHIRNGK